MSSGFKSLQPRLVQFQQSGEDLTKEGVLPGPGHYDTLGTDSE